MTAHAVIAGEPEIWDRKWRDISGGPNECLYTTEKPATFHQRTLRAYYDLLCQRSRPDHKRFLEIGSGRGTTSQYLAAAGKDVTLLDTSSFALEMARKNFARFNLPEPHTLIGDAVDTKLPDAVFDCVHSVGLLEHFEEPAELLAECHRLLKAGGLSHHVIMTRGSTKEFWRNDSPPEKWIEASPVVSAQCRRTPLTGVYELWWYKD